MVATGSSSDYFPPSMAPTIRFSGRLLLAVAAGLCSFGPTGCSLEGAGEPPPPGTIYYPTGIALSEGNGFLYVVSSNFDRRYSAGSLQAYDLSALDAKIQEQCGDALGLDCEVIPTPEDGVLHSEVLIGSLGRALTLSSDGLRVYVPTHADGALTYVDVDPEDVGTLSCGGARVCPDAYRRGDDAAESPRGYVLPPDPIALAAAPLAAQTCLVSPCTATGDALVMIHRRGEVSLLVDRGDAPPVLVDVQSGLAGDLTGITFEGGAAPTGDAEPLTGGLFFISNATSTPGTLKVLYRVSVFVDEEVEHSVLRLLDPLQLRGVHPNRSTWALRTSLGPTGDSAVVVSQQPDALLTVALSADRTEGQVTHLAEVGAGASRLAVGRLSGPDGATDVAIVSCLGERRLYVLDATTGVALSILTGFSGPFEVTLDEERNRAYVADFRASVVRVVDLSPITRRGSARFLATLGRPNVLEELQ